MLFPNLIPKPPEDPAEPELRPSRKKSHAGITVGDRKRLPGVNLAVEVAGLLEDRLGVPVKARCRVIRGSFKGHRTICIARLRADYRDEHTRPIDPPPGSPPIPPLRDGALKAFPALREPLLCRWPHLREVVEGGAAEVASIRIVGEPEGPAAMVAELAEKKKQRFYVFVGTPHPGGGEPDWKAAPSATNRIENYAKAEAAIEAAGRLLREMRERAR